MECLLYQYLLFGGCCNEAVFVIFIWYILTYLILTWVIKGVPSWPVNQPVKNIPYTIFFAMIIAPLWEELAYRVGPFLIARKFNVTFPVMLISASIFGWGHGYGPISIIWQGVMGFIFSCVYIKNNYSYWSAALTHCIWNIIATFLI